jgi:nicotinamidase-related amidase
MPLIPPTASLLAIDLQTRLVPVIHGHEQIVLNAQRLVQAAVLLDLPIIATEQYPKGLGPTLPGILPKALRALPKTTFDAMATPAIANRMSSASAVIAFGAETHICLLQTVLSLRARGFSVFVVADASGSRTGENHAAGLARMAGEGAQIVTTEMVLFESLRDAAHPQFRAVSALIK